MNFYFLGFEVLHKDQNTAVDEFRKARDAAQMAFGVVPEASDKILASKILVTASFDEFSENLETALTLSSKYLDRMNSLPEVVKASEFIYSPEKSLGKRMLSLTGTSKREDILHGVAEINKSVYDFFNGKLENDLNIVPVIRFGKYHINPIFTMVLQRKPVLIADIEKSVSAFISVTICKNHLFAALGHESGSSMINDILAINLETGHKTHLLGHKGIVLEVCSNQKFLFSASYDKEIIVWDLEKFHPVKVLSGHTGSVRSLCVSETRLFSGSADKTVRVWSLDTLECEHTEIFEDAITKVTCSRRKFLFVLHGLFSVQIWDIKKMAKLQEITTRDCQFVNVIANDNNLFVPAKSKEGRLVHCYNLGSLTLDATIKEPGVNLVKFYNSPYIYIGDKTIRMINTKSQRLVLEKEVSVYGQSCDKIRYMTIHDAELFVLAQNVTQNSNVLLKY